MAEDALAEFYGPNAGYALELLEREEAQAAAQAQPTGGEIPQAALSQAAAAAALATGIRLFGHRGAQLYPLGNEPPGDPQLDYGAHGVTEDDLEKLPASVVGGPTASAHGIDTAKDAIHQLERIYCHTTGYEFAHVEDPAERTWLLQAIEEERFRPPNDPIDERELLDRLTEVSAFERFLHRAYPGQTRFSVEGLGMLIPMLDELIADAAAHGTRTILLGMAHRGRLNVLAHVLGKPYERILAEFEGREPTRRNAPSESTDEGWTGDVKYHAGARRAVRPNTASNSGTVSVVMAPNPSHLEFVNPVVQGMARAADEDRKGAGAPRQDEATSLGVQIHGDAAFPGQGVVAETLNLSRLAGYRTGGTLHIIANNQLGFTTEPADSRSTLYASDLAKGFEMPIVHVNADDPIACLAAVRLAVAYRAEFAKDVLIDLIGYRRWGHNEGDDPSFTQPRTYAAVNQHPTVRERFAADLVARGVVREGEPEAFLKAGLDEFQRIRERVRARSDGHEPAATLTLPGEDTRNGTAPSTRESVSWDSLKRLNDALLTFPDGFSVHPKLERSLQRRRAAFERPDAPIDFGHAESLAFATLLTEGVPIRLTGQDSVRGTFSQRHLTFYDATTGTPYTPLTSVPGQRATFDVHNSPLSESAPLGFEYGYSVQAPDTLVLWEAQYGDFIDGAQVMVDEFVVSGQAKWGLVSGLVLLLPHAWEGQGPDHSSSRLERFLQLAAEDNMRVANCTTAAQYFFLLRRQAHSLGRSARPLIVLTPKSLLRYPLASSRAQELSDADGRFMPVLDDVRTRDRPDRVQRLVLCSGHIWAELEADQRRAADDSLAVVRVEEFYPFPESELRQVLERYSAAREVVWLQEEPRNMGAWTFMSRHLRPLLGSRTLRYCGRPERASPAEGWSDAHAAEQRRILSEILEPREVVAHAR